MQYRHAVPQGYISQRDKRPEHNWHTFCVSIRKNIAARARVHLPDSNRGGYSHMIIEAENLTKIYCTEEVETTALDRINLQLEEGQFVSIMGPSGCGKSTLLHVLGLIDDLSDGNYLFMGEDVSRYSERKRSAIRKKNIGFVFQSFNLIDELTVFENIELPLIYGKAPAQERKSRVEAALEKMDITARRNHFPRQLSGGQQQRVAVARAIINQPKLILADEPTGNLDSEHGADVMNMLVKLNEEGTTILMVTHSVENAAYSGNVIQLHDGRIVPGEKETVSNGRQ
jgi:putative ABC transport system ATP-binding protein